MARLQRDEIDHYHREGWVIPRWQLPAAQLAGLHDVPVVVRDTPESDRLELAVLENLQRLDLSPIEEAAAYRQLMDVREYTQEQLAERPERTRVIIYLLDGRPTDEPAAQVRATVERVIV